MLRSRQGLYLRRCCVQAAEPPVFKQFLSMYHHVSSPIPGPGSKPCAVVGLDHRQSADIDGGFELTVSGVKMCWRVIIEEHSDQAPIECTDRRHPARLI